MSHTYVLFDRSTGAVLGVSTHYDVARGADRRQSADEVLEQFAASLGDREANEVDVLEVDLPVHALQEGFRVDTARRKLVPKLELQLEAERTELDGDGKDTTEIEIRAVDQDGKTARRFAGELRVATTRGRLDPKGGRAKARAGKCRVTLTSAAETVQRVLVTAEDPKGLCRPGVVELEFL
jgi:hypothetical protein